MWVVLDITNKWYAVGSNPIDFIFPLFLPGEKRDLFIVFSSLRAGNANSCDRLLLSNNVIVSGEGRTLEIPADKVVQNRFTRTLNHIFGWLYSTTH